MIVRGNDQIRSWNALYFVFLSTNAASFMEAILPRNNLNDRNLLNYNL